MKWKLCFRIIAKLGNSKRQHCSRQEKKNKAGTIVRKSPQRKRKEEEKTEKKKSLFLFAYESQ